MLQPPFMEIHRARPADAESIFQLYEKNDTQVNMQFPIETLRVNPAGTCSASIEFVYPKASITIARKPLYAEAISCVASETRVPSRCAKGIRVARSAISEVKNSMVTRTGVSNTKGSGTSPSANRLTARAALVKINSCETSGVRHSAAYLPVACF